MKINELSAEIRDLNLAYLMLARQMLRTDKASAIYRLGIDSELAGLVESLNNAQLIRLASSTLMLLRFRLGDAGILGKMASDAKAATLAQSHAAILMAGEPMETMA